MDGILNNRINKWILEFSQSELDWDSYHIDEFQECKIPKSKWIEYAFKVYSICEEILLQCKTKNSVALCFELNITTSHCSVPLRLSRQCFSKTESHPEIYLFKNKEKRSDLLSEALYLHDLSVLYDMQVYLLEKRDDVYWRWLFFMDKDTASVPNNKGKVRYKKE